MIIGDPSELLVFSPTNREVRVDCIGELSIQPDKSYYDIETNFPLSQEYTVLINSINIKLVKWSKNCISFQIVEPVYNDSNLNNSNTSIVSDSDDQDDDANPSMDTKTQIIIHVYILFSNYEIDNEKGNYLGLIGYMLIDSIDYTM